MKIILIIILKFLTIKSQDENNCEKSQTLSPIDINFPLAEMDFQINYDFSNNLKFKKNELTENTYKIKTYFGKIYYNKIRFEVNEIIFISPSEHLIASNRFGMEMKILGTSEIHNLQMIILFDEISNLDNELLENFNFLKKGADLKKSQDVFSLNDFFLDSNNFFLYKGKSTFYDCKDTLHVIYSLPSFVSTNQLEIFTNPSIREKIRHRDPKDIALYINKKLSNFTNLKKKYTFAKTPGNLIYSIFLFRPEENLQLGIFGNCVPFWEKNLLEILEENNFIKNKFLNGFEEFKYFCLCYKKILDNFYIPQYVMVDDNFSIDEDLLPKKIPIYLRNKDLDEKNVFKMFKINFPIILLRKHMDDSFKIMVEEIEALKKSSKQTKDEILKNQLRKKKKKMLN